MAKFDDKQIDVRHAGGETHSPAGSTPAHGADAPFVHPGVAPTGADGKALPTLQKIALGLRMANPA